MKDVKILAGVEKPIPVSDIIFSDEVCAFLASLSSSLMKNPAALSFPDIVSFAYFCRKASIASIKAEYGGEHRVGRGLAFHIAPGNVPINFAFSFAFGLMSGNANIVRVSSKDFPQTSVVCGEIAKILNKFPKIMQSCSIVSYPSDCGASEEYSSAADVRIIWGGDETVNKIKAMQTKPRCIDIAFSDRYSIGIINGKAVTKADDSEIERLCEQFYNDTYLMDQNACSTPQTLFWLNASEDAKERFYSAVASFADKKYNLQAESAVNKYVKLCGDIIKNPEIKVRRCGNILTSVCFSILPDNITDMRGNCGYFYEYDISDLSEIDHFVNSRFQTACYYGIDKEKITNWLVRSGLSGIDRAVPFGNSLDIGNIWDGYDIIRFSSRIISVK